MNRKKIDKQIFDFEPTIKHFSDTHWAYRVLFTAPEVGPFKDKFDMQRKIEGFWKVKKGRLNKFIYRAIRNEIVMPAKKKFLDGDIYSDGIGLALGCGVLTGMIERGKTNPRPQNDEVKGDE